MKMRGIYSSVTDIRRKVFTEVARLAYEEGDYAEKIAELPYKIVPGSKAVYRESIFLERAIVEERLRLAIGLPLRPIEEHKSVADGIEESAIAEKYYDPPLVNIIKLPATAVLKLIIMLPTAVRAVLRTHVRKSVQRVP